MNIIKKSVKEIIPNNYNPNKIDETKFKSLIENIKRFGYIQPVLIDSNNVIIDGEHRFKACIEAGLTEIECVVWESDETTQDYKKLLTLSMNNLRGENDEEKFQQLIEDISKSINIDDISLLTGFDESFLIKTEIDYATFDILKNINSVNDELEEAKDIKLEIEIKDKFGKYDMPLLDINKCIDCNDLKVFTGQRDFNFDIPFIWLFNSMSFKQIKNYKTMIPCFYTDDIRFDCLWKEPDRYFKKFLNLGVTTIFTPNFSLYLGMPLAWQIYNVYRSRYLSYFMQKVGFNIIPDLNFSDERSLEFAFDGIPSDIPCGSIQVQHVKEEHEIKNFINGMNRILEVIKPKKLLVYGGKNKEILLKKYEKECIIVYIDSYSMEKWNKKGENI